MVGSLDGLSVGLVLVGIYEGTLLGDSLGLNVGDWLLGFIVVGFGLGGRDGLDVDG